jgi:hypothetical protein
MTNERDRERDILGGNLCPAAFEERHPRQRPDCPPIGEVIAAAQGQADADVVEKVSTHIQQCGYCLTCFQAYKQAWEAPPSSDPLLRSLAVQVETAGSESGRR